MNNLQKIKIPTLPNSPYWVDNTHLCEIIAISQQIQQELSRKIYQDIYQLADSSILVVNSDGCNGLIYANMNEVEFVYVKSRLFDIYSNGRIVFICVIEYDLMNNLIETVPFTKIKNTVNKGVKGDIYIFEDGRILELDGLQSGLFFNNLIDFEAFNIHIKEIEDDLINEYE